MLDTLDDPDPNPAPKITPILSPLRQERPSTGPRRESWEDDHKATMTPGKGRQMEFESPSSEDQNPIPTIPEDFPLSNDDVFFNLKVNIFFP